MYLTDDIYIQYIYIVIHMKKKIKNKRKKRKIEIFKNGILPAYPILNTK